MPKTHIVIPCFNEAHRLPLAEIKTLVDDSNTYLILVNDGSSDDTQAVLRSLADNLNGQGEILDLKINVGKGEAVRQGLRRALDLDASILGFIDADMATPADETRHLIEKLSSHDLDAVFGSRVALLGHNIERSPIRHYLGRIFATAAALVLNLAIYDTQCGAKFFRNTANLKTALETPFLSRWAFDVELIGRLSLLGGPSRLKEIPLRKWCDKGGSRLSTFTMFITLLSLIGIRHRLRQFKKP